MRFGGLLAIDDVSFAAGASEITSIIGPNGAGKTTLFNCLTGFYKPTVGRLALTAWHGDFLLARREGFRSEERGGGKGGGSTGSTWGWPYASKKKKKKIENY